MIVLAPEDTTAMHFECEEDFVIHSGCPFPVAPSLQNLSGWQEPGGRFWTPPKCGTLSTTMKTLVVVLLGFTVTAAFGDPVELTLSGVATGTFGAIPFINDPFTVTAGGDTGSVFLAPGLGDELPATGATINLAGFSPAAFTDATSWIDPQGSGDIIFNDVTRNAELLGFTHLFAGLETYQFQSSIGPIVGGFPFLPNIFENFLDIPTSEGLLTITMTSDNAFAAVVATPEPASLRFALAVLSAAIVLGQIRRSLRS
jgi:hypothetical protein